MSSARVVVRFFSTMGLTWFVSKYIYIIVIKVILILAVSVDIRVIMHSIFKN
jgi:hypothetical protein